MRLRLAWAIIRFGSRVLPRGYGVMVLSPRAMAQAAEYQRQAMDPQPLEQVRAVQPDKTPAAHHGGQYI